MQVYDAEIGANASGSKGSNADYGGNEQGTQIDSEVSESSRGRGYPRGRGGNRGSFRVCGKTDDVPRDGG